MRKAVCVRAMKATMAIFVAAGMIAGGEPAAIAAPGHGAVRAAAIALPAAGAVVTAPTWPRVIERDGNHVIVYQPQLRSWSNYRTLVADTAISITPANGKQVLGVISWRADTQANVALRTVYVHDIEVISSRFPSLDPQADAAMQAKVSQFYPTMTFNISLDRMIAMAGKTNVPVQSIAVNTEVPNILVSYGPAIVLTVDDKPILAPVEGTSLKYVVNCNWDLFFDDTNYYLLANKVWLKSKDLIGPWTATAKIPADMAKLPKEQWAEVLKSVPATAGTAPKVFYTQKPAELIVFTGQPVFAPVPGTSLSYATNTTSSVFKENKSGQIYVLLSGRWFRAGKVDAPYVYAGNDLPADFARIPQGRAYSSVLVSVPGTVNANDAVLLSQVPTTAVINKAAAEAAVKVVYVDAPKFVPIPGTTMLYAVNTQERVIQVNDMYYLCSQGIWFVSRSPMGAWKVAETVPAVIYTIPPSSPVYNVTYVTVSNPTATTVQTSYSSGYMGVFVLGMTVGAVVVYGTGYYYPPYIYYGPRYPVYYPYPYTYGCAWVYNPYTGFYGVGHAVYGPYASAGTAAWYNPATGMYGHAVTYQNAYGGHTYASAYNPWTGTYAATSQGHNAYAQWGSSVVTNGNNWAEAQHYTNANGTAGSFQTSKGSEGAGVTGKNGNSAFVAKDANNNNVYAGADGNVYKKDSDGNWSKYSDGGWTPVDPSTGLQQTKNSKQGNTTPTTAPGSNGSGTEKGSGNRSGNIGGSGGTQQSGAGTANGAGNVGGSGGTQSGASSRASNARNGQAGSGGTTAVPGATNEGNSGGGSALGSQLNNDANSRARGDQLEQGQSRGGGGARGSRGGGGGGRSPRR